MTLFFSALTAGLAIGSIYGLVGIGYTVVFSATRIFNLAQGDLVMVAVMTSYYLIELKHVPQVVACILVILFVAAISVAEERVIVRPFLKRGSNVFGWFIATLGFAAIIETVVTIRMGNRPISAIASPSASFSAVSSESASRAAMSGRTTRRSTTTSMSCLYFLSSAGTSAIW